MDNNKIWLVWNPQGRQPSHVHHSESEAQKEAKRLARINPEQSFYVMESKGFARKNEVSYYVHSQSQELNDEIPF